MAIPAVTQTITDNALGLVPADTSANTAVVGICSSGTVATVYAYQSADAIDDLRTDLGYGPAVEAAAYHLSTNGSPVYVVRVTGANDEAESAVTLDGSGLDPGVTVDAATAAYDDYDVKIKIVLGGAVATATFRYSLDGGTNYSGVITSAATYAIPNSGITIAFTAGTYVADDVYSFTTTCETYSASDMGTAIQALIDSDYDFGLLHVVGMPTGATDALKAADYATRIATVQTKLATAATGYRYARAICDGPNVANSSAGDTELTGDFAAVDASRVITSAGFCDLISATDERRLKRPAAWPAVARARQVPISEHLGWVGRGSLGASIYLENAAGTKYLDSRTRSTLDGARFLTLRTHIGKSGAFITRPNTMAAEGSDFSSLHNCRVIDRACTVAYSTLLNFLNQSVRVTAATGRILEADAVAIEKQVESALRAALTQPGFASDVACTVNRTDNILSTQTLRVKTRVTPLGYAEQIENEIGFTNPALSVVST